MVILFENKTHKLRFITKLVCTFYLSRWRCGFKMQNISSHDSTYKFSNGMLHILLKGQSNFKSTFINDFFYLNSQLNGRLIDLKNIY